ncbi:ribosome hibernation promotion factor [Saccharopolyspora elongata]|uniref:ribosome hibernation promotion factor n=1 Tax=Saccharopolyspora elongata TaxID=2530387 RepID=UPI001F4540F3|nr:HPF/RaiA family ribosome-associated protein [Saccharopolyspora elongata]
MAQNVPISVQVTGEVAPGIADYAERRVRSALRYAHEPVLHARVRVQRHGDPAVARPITAQANLDVNGRIVRVQVAGSVATEALDLLRDRLQHRLEHIARRRKRGAVVEPHEWRHGGEPAHRPSYFPRPPDQCEVVRHKSFTLARCDVDEAVFEMEVMDYDFHLFTELGSEQDSVLYRTPDGYRLAQVDPHPAELAEHFTPVTVSERPPPVLTTVEAAERLGTLGLPFLFYLDGERGRSAVLYRRYDGHYGLITPAE